MVCAPRTFRVWGLQKDLSNYLYPTVAAITDHQLPRIYTRFQPPTSILSLPYWHLYYYPYYRPYYRHAASSLRSRYSYINPSLTKNGRFYPRAKQGGPIRKLLYTSRLDISRY